MKWLYNLRMGRRAVQESVKLTACDKLVSSDRGRYIAMVAKRHSGCASSMPTKRMCFLLMHGAAQQTPGFHAAWG